MPIRPLHSLLPRLPTRTISRTNCPIHLSDGLRLGQGRHGRPHVMARSLLHYHYFPLSELPKSARRSALLVQIRAWSPFPETAYAIILRAQGAMVFAWDVRAFRQRLETAGRDGSAARVIPETLLFPTQQEGLSLLRCIEGWEGQLWRDGDLVQSRWWPERPDADSWLNFQRGAGLPAEEQQASLPGPDGDAWSVRPWARTIDIETLSGHDRLKEHLLTGTMALILLVPSLHLLHYWQETEAAWTRASNTHDQLKETAGPILAAREETSAALGAIKAIAKHVDRPHALSLLAHVSRVMPRDGSHIRELEWQGDRLRLVLATSATASRSVYIRAFETHWLRDVRETPESTMGLISLSARVERATSLASDSPRSPSVSSEPRRIVP